MLERDPAKRATAHEVLGHEWMRERGCAGDAPIELEVVRRLRAYSAMHRLKKEVIKVGSGGPRGRSHERQTERAHAALNRQHCPL